MQVASISSVDQWTFPYKPDGARQDIYSNIYDINIMEAKLLHNLQPSIKTANNKIDNIFNQYVKYLRKAKNGILELLRNKIKRGDSTLSRSNKILFELKLKWTQPSPLIRNLCCTILLICYKIPRL